MRRFDIKRIRTFLKDEAGVTLVEYGVAVAFAIVAGGFMVSILKPGFAAAMTAAVKAMAK